MKRSQIISGLVFILTCFLVGVLLNLAFSYVREKKESNKKLAIVIEAMIESLEESPPDTTFLPIEKPFQDSVFDYMTELRMAAPKVVLAQAKLETGNFTSRIFLNNHNLFGMRKSGSRPSTATGVEHGHAYYTGWKQSVLDYALLQAYNRSCKIKTNEAYIQNLVSSGYAQDTTYAMKLRTIVKTIQ